MIICLDNYYYYILAIRPRGFERVNTGDRSFRTRKKNSLLYNIRIERIFMFNKIMYIAYLKVFLNFIHP